MNPQFEARQQNVFEILNRLSAESKKLRQTLIFVGGSAVQSVLPKPARLSIDLDVHYSGKTRQLLECLEPEFEIESRHSWNDTQFEFFKATRQGVQVKIDFAHASISKGQFALQKVGTKKSHFMTLTGTKEYLLASKLSALAIGTIGRRKEKKDFQTGYLKDVIDANELSSSKPFNSKIWKDLKTIVKAQNRLRNTNFTFQQAIDSIKKTLLESIRSDDSGIITQGVRQNFREYLREKTLQKSDYWRIAARIAACIENSPKNIPLTRLDSFVQKNYQNKTKVNEWIEILLKKKVDKELLHQLKAVDAHALGYYYLSKNQKETSKK